MGVVTDCGQSRWVGVVSRCDCKADRWVWSMNVIAEHIGGCGHLIYVILQLMGGCVCYGCGHRTEGRV